MCKVMMMSGIKNKENALMFTKRISHYMSRGNDHGLGYSAMDSKGNIFGERWLYNATAWQDTAPVDESASRVLTMFPNVTNLNEKEIPFEYNKFGKVKLNDIVTIMLHTRYATSAKGMVNTHPFVTPNNKTALIHNGIISNHSDFKLTLSSCDSEAILISYLDNKVKQNVTNIQKLSDSLRGYYACGILTSDSNLNTLDIFRANGASLYMAYVYELETYVFTTDDSDLKATCKDLNFTHEDIYKVNDETLIRINALTGELILTEKFNAAPRYSPTPSRYAGVKDVTGWNMNNQSTSISMHKNKGTSKELIEYYKQTPSISRISEREVQEEIFNKYRA